MSTIRAHLFLFLFACEIMVESPFSAANKGTHQRPSRKVSSSVSGSLLAVGVWGLAQQRPQKDCKGRSADSGAG